MIFFKRAVAAMALSVAVTVVQPVEALAATFTATPPPVVAKGTPVVWTFASDAPGTTWGHVTWAVSTEPSAWSMCGGETGSVKLEGLGPGVYWVEIADEVDPAFAPAGSDGPPFDRCTEPQPAPLGPLRPVTLSWVEVVAPPDALPPSLEEPPAGDPEATATTAVTVLPAAAGGCGGRNRLRGLRSAVRSERRALTAARGEVLRRRLLRRLRADRARLRRTRVRCS